MDNKNIAISISLEQVCNDLLSNCNLISKNIVDEALADIRADIQSPDSDETRSLICRATTEAWGKVKYQAQRYLTTGRSVDDNSLERIAHLSEVKMYYRLTEEEGAVTTFEQQEHLIIEHDKSTAQIETGTEDGTCLVIAVPAGVSFDAYDVDGNDLVIDGEAKVSEVKYYNNVFSEDGVSYNEYCFTDTENWVSVTFDDSAFVQEYEVLDLLLRIPNFNLGVTDALKSSIHKFMVDYVTSRFLRDLNPEKAASYTESADNEQENIRKCLNSRERIYQRRASWL